MMALFIIGAVPLPTVPLLGIVPLLTGVVPLLTGPMLGGVTGVLLVGVMLAGVVFAGLVIEGRGQVAKHLSVYTTVPLDGR